MVRLPCAVPGGYRRRARAPVLGRAGGPGSGPKPLRRLGPPSAAAAPSARGGGVAGVVARRMVCGGGLFHHGHAAPGSAARAGPAPGAVALGPAGPVARGGAVPARLSEVLKLLGFEALPALLVRGQPT